jgi:hypothetical protein
MHARKMHIEMHAHEVRAHEMHARKVHAYETPAHYCFGGSLAQTVIDLSRSEFQNTSFCASCGWSLLPAAPAAPEGCLIGDFTVQSTRSTAVLAAL